MKKAWTIYVLAPIDYRWRFLRSVKETLEILVSEAFDMRDLFAGDLNEEELKIIPAFLNDYDMAKTAAKESGWEGDFVGEPYVFWVPYDTEMLYGFVWKQGNNGTTFVVSPVPLDYLQTLAM